MKRELEIRIMRNRRFHNVTDIYHLYNKDGILTAWDSTLVKAIVFEKPLNRYQFIEELAEYCATSRGLPQIIAEEMNVNKCMADNTKFLESPFTVLSIFSKGTMKESYQLDTPTVCGEESVRFTTFGERMVFDVAMKFKPKRYSLGIFRLLGHPRYAPLLVRDKMEEEEWRKKAKKILMGKDEMWSSCPLLEDGSGTHEDRIMRHLKLQYIDLFEMSNTINLFLRKKNERTKAPTV